MPKFLAYPFPFTVDDTHFLYDPVSNEIFEVDGIFFDAARSALRDPDPGVAWREVRLPLTQANELSELRRRGFLTGSEIEAKAIPSVDSLYMHDGKTSLRSPKSCTIEVTDSCNLRCTYCVYSSRTPRVRGHGTRVASPEFLKECVDFFRRCVSRNNADEDVCSIGFYGGEPLLAFERILSAIDYAKRSWSKPEKLGFHFTTNGVLLTPARARQLVDRKVVVTISIDGDKNTHDWGRVDKLGRGSFNKVMENIRGIAAMLGDDIDMYVKLQATIDDITAGTDILGFQDLIASEPFLQRLDVRLLRRVVDSGTGYSSRIIPVEVESEARSRIWDRYLDSAFSENIRMRGIQSCFHTETLGTIHNREFGRVEGTMPLLGACVPGCRKIYINLDGEIYPCEKASRRDRIGTLRDGIDLISVARVLEDWNVALETACEGCWAIRFCRRCLGQIVDSENTCQEIRKSCEVVRGEFAFALSLYCHMLSTNSNSLSYLKKRSGS